MQPVRLLIVKSDEAKEKLAKAANIYNAPVAIIVCADTNKAWTRPFDGMKTTDIDASIITDHMMLTATEQGLDVYKRQASGRPFRKWRKNGKQRMSILIKWSKIQI